MNTTFQKASFFFLALLLSIACSETNFQNDELPYSTESDSALKYYRQGWIQIMDEGRYAEAERSYRKALEYDPEFLAGQAVLARLTLSLNERLALYDSIQKLSNRVIGNERLVLDVYTAFADYTNQRDQQQPTAKKTLKNALLLAEKNLRQVVHRYPNEIYLKAEYLEILHSLYGPSQTLDSLDALTSAIQKDNPFLLGHAASMNAELGNYELALKKAQRLQSQFEDVRAPKPFAVFADIYFQMDSLRLAKINADKANALDSRNLDASRLKVRIDKKLAED